MKEGLLHGLHIIFSSIISSFYYVIILCIYISYYQLMFFLTQRLLHGLAHVRVDDVDGEGIVDGQADGLGGSQTIYLYLSSLFIILI